MVDITEISAIVAAAGVFVGVVYYIMGYEASYASQTDQHGDGTILESDR